MKGTKAITEFSPPPYPQVRVYNPETQSGWNASLADPEDIKALSGADPREITPYLAEEGALLATHYDVYTDPEVLHRAADELGIPEVAEASSHEEALELIREKAPELERRALDLITPEIVTRDIRLILVADSPEEVDKLEALTQRAARPVKIFGGWKELEEYVKKGW